MVDPHPAAGPTSQALAEPAQRLGPVTRTQATIAGPALRQALREARPHSRWLLISDNAGRTGPPQPTPRPDAGGSPEIDVFTPEQSTEPLHRCRPPLKDDQAEALGDLPPAPEQPAAWQAETGMPPPSTRN
ncbi:hypothetical protein ABT072_46720 [Streptomyces sp. NPDC002589]|uniref:hypothetical protein n=1 Tax=Streptomyces sp. NPDC002589 TaxID=3154420 RepID=UPI00332FB1DC